MFALENEGQSDGEQHPQWRHSMANIKIYKDITHFCTSFTISEILPFLKIFTKQFRSRSWSTTFGMMPLQGEYQPL